MARFRRILRLSVWWCCLLCVLSVTQVATATNRIDVNMPSPESVAKGGGLPSRSGNSLSIPGLPKQEYIPRTPGGTPGTPFKVLPRIDFSIPRTIKGVTGALRLNPVSLAGSAAVGLALGAIDAVLDPENNSIQIPTITEVPPEGPYFAWYNSLGGHVHSSPKASCQAYYDATSGYTATKVERIRDDYYRCEGLYQGQTWYYNGNVERRGNGCPSGSSYSPVTAGCVAVEGMAPPTESQWDSIADSLGKVDPDWLKDLLNDYCSGSNAPARCFDELSENSSLSGPSSVTGPSSTSSGTYTKPDGTTGTTSTTNNTRYDIKYGNNYYNYSTTTTTTKTTDGTTTETNTTTDAGSPETQQPPKEQEKEEEKPSPCTGANCDGPAYTDLYEPTTETKEQHIDGYLSRISGIPIFQAVTGLFDVQVGGSCPVWQVHKVVPILGYNFTIDLVFDFLCLPWIISMGPWIRAVIYAVATGYAIRVAIL